MELLRKLAARAEQHDPIRVGIIGCGQMGSGLAHAISNVRGMRVAAIADINPQRGIDTLAGLGVDRGDIIVTDAPSAAGDALARGKRVVSADALLMTRLDGLEANVEATGVPDIGARVAWESIEQLKPIIMLNVETDITIGALLSHTARAKGALYTVASGDEPGVCAMLYEQAMLMGFEVVCLGKGKNNPIDYAATPESCAVEAAAKDMNPKMLAAFKDGTKTMVEMAAVSNATGLLPDIPGMHAPEAQLDELVKTFVPREDGGIFSRRGCVDYTTGAIAPGVFAIVYSADARVRKDMKFITRADGPYYLHFRPYHLCDLETPQSIAEAVLLHEVTVAAQSMHSEVACIAKRRIRRGEKVAGIGSADIYGRIYPYAQARAEAMIPIGIAENGTALADIDRGQPMSAENFLPVRDSVIATLRARQDAWLS